MSDTGMDGAPGIATQIERFLRGRRDEGWCTRCLASELRLRRPYTATARLEGYRGFRRDHGTCAACKKFRLVLRYVGTGTPVTS
jgi:hypothetical protein